MSKQHVMNESKFLSDTELADFINICEKHPGIRDTILLRLLLYTGARGVEIRGVRKCDLGRQTVAIRGAKGSNDRVLPLSGPFFKELKEFVKGMDEDELLFPIAARTLRHIWYQYRPNCRKGVHCLRHTFGVRLCMNCGDVHTVQTALGHKNYQSTEIYLRFVESQKKLRASIRGMWSERNKLDAA